MITAASFASSLPVREDPGLGVPEQRRGEIRDLNSHQHQHSAQKDGRKGSVAQSALQSNGDGECRNDHQQARQSNGSARSGSEKGETNVQHGVTKDRAVQTTYVRPQDKFQ